MSASSPKEASRPGDTQQKSTELQQQIEAHGSATDGLDVSDSGVPVKKGFQMVEAWLAEMQLPDAVPVGAGGRVL